MVGRREPAPGLFRRLDGWARASLPTVAAALMMIMAAAPVGLPSAVPAIALVSVFFWSVFRPAAMPPPAVFTIGLLQDMLTFAPLGVSVFILLLVHGLAMRWRRQLARQSFLVVWLAFCGFATVAALLGYLLTALLGWTLPPPISGLHLLGLSAGFYPALSFLLTRAHAAIRLAEERP